MGKNIRCFQLSHIVCVFDKGTQETIPRLSGETGQSSSHTSWTLAHLTTCTGNKEPPGLGESHRKVAVMICWYSEVVSEDGFIAISPGAQLTPGHCTTALSKTHGCMGPVTANDAPALRPGPHKECPRARGKGSGCPWPSTQQGGKLVAEQVPGLGGPQHFGCPG